MHAAAVVSDGGPLAVALGERLAGNGRRVMMFAPAAAARARLAIRGDSLAVDGERVAAVAFLVSPDVLSAGRLVDADERLATAEARALWLAALHLPTIAAVNRYDADAWFRGAGWPVWRPRLRAAGVPLGPLAVGRAATADWRWLPWGSPRPRAAPGRAGATFTAAAHMPRSASCPCLLVQGRALSPGFRPAPPPGLGPALKAHGIGLAEAWLDVDGRVCVLDPCPAPCEPPVVARAAEALAGMLT